MCHRFSRVNISNTSLTLTELNLLQHAKANKLDVKSHCFAKLIHATITEIRKVLHSHTHTHSNSLQFAVKLITIQLQPAPLVSPGSYPTLNFRHYSSVDFATKVRSRPIYLLLPFIPRPYRARKLFPTWQIAGAIRFAISTFRSKADKRSLPLSIKAATI